MALHTKLLKHNVLLVSKLKKLSHTTQAIERNFDLNAPLCSTLVKSADDDKTTVNGPDRQQADLWSWPVASPSHADHKDCPQSSQQPLPLGILELLTWPYQQLPAVVCQERGLYPVIHPNLDVVISQKQREMEKSLTTTLFPKDCLPLVVKPVSYTTDDIIVCPGDSERELRVKHEVVHYENHTVTVLNSHPGDFLQHPDRDAGLFRGKDSQPSNIAGHSAPSKQSKRHARRHSICDSNPASCIPQVTNTLLCSTGSASSTALCSTGQQEPAEGGDGGPNLDQLRAVEAYFIEKIPTFLKARLDYRVYHPGIVFENNFWGTNEVSVGINQYAVQMMKMRALTHLKYAHVHMEVVSSICLPEEGIVRVQWRVVGLSQLKALRFWKYTAWSYSKSFREDAEWIDGISILHVNKDGLITKHRIDRMTPDEEQMAKAPTLAVKLAVLLGLGMPKPGLSDCTSLLFRR